jgi:hypothetical protein
VSPRDKSSAKPKTTGPVKGSGPDGAIELGDIRSKLGEIRGDIDDVADTAKPYLTYAAVAGAIAVIAIAFIAGKRRGRRKATWVEIKRL